MTIHTSTIDTNVAGRASDLFAPAAVQHPPEETLDTVPLTDLESKGYVVIRGLLSPDEVAECRDDFTSQRVARNQIYSVSFASRKALDRVKSRIERVMALVSERTAVKVDLMLLGAYFSTGGGTQFAWHQDYESYYLFNDHYNYLNFYIPVIKPRKDKTNLMVVPFDVLARECPRTFKRTVGKGAASFVAMGDRHLAMCDDGRLAHLTSTSLDRIAETPMLDAGDLLLMRGDIIHRTQDSETERVALSVRVAYTKTRVRRSELAVGGRVKTKWMSTSPRAYENLFHAFDEARTSELDVAHLAKYGAAHASDPASSPKRFRQYLLKERIRSGVMLSSARRALADTANQARVALYKRRHR